MRIRIAHSPDSDDAFMFYALTAGKIYTDGLQIEHVLADIETLNREALKGTYEISAISFHAYPYVADKYLVLPSGGSVGEGYGPIVVSKQALNSLKGKRIGVPGKLTTAFLVLKLYEPDFEEVVMPFDQILLAVQEGRVDAGLVIHEGQLSYVDKGLKKIVDLGQWWQEKTGLPLPLFSYSGYKRPQKAPSLPFPDLLHTDQAPFLSLPVWGFPLKNSDLSAFSAPLLLRCTPPHIYRI